MGVNIQHAGGGGSGGNVATDTIFDAKGDLAVGTGADAAARLAVGTNGKSIVADSSQSTGLTYVQILTKSPVVWGLQSIVTAGGAKLISVDGLQLYGGYISHTSPNINDSMDNGFVCLAGTYTLNVIGATNTSHGITTVYIDGVSIGTIDWYSGSPVRNATKTISSVVLTNGYHKITFTVTSKNVSSSAYNWVWTAAWFEPSAY
jgi:hypothetical protein